MNERYHHGALREALLDAAQTILERDGIAALTLRAAAREAGVSHAAPNHHFGSLGGLVSELAARGFEQLRAQIVRASGENSGGRGHVAALAAGYIGFARSAPGLFRLMFRAEQLDWSRPALAQAGAAAFALLIPLGPDGEPVAIPLTPAQLGTAMAQWSMLHGMASLLIDGRLEAVAAELAPSVEGSTLQAEILRHMPEGERVVPLA